MNYYERHIGACACNHASVTKLVRTHQSALVTLNNGQAVTTSIAIAIAEDIKAMTHWLVFMKPARRT